MPKETEALRMLRSGVEKCRLAMATAIPANPAAGEPAIVTKARTATTAAFAAFDRVDEVCANAAGRLAPIASDPALSPAGRKDKLAAESSKITVEVSAAISTIKASYTTVIEATNAVLRTARPATVDEAAIAARKTDLLLVLDRIADPALLVQRLARFAADGLADDRPVDAWLVMRTDWPQLVLESRGAEMYAPMLDQEIAALADRRADMAGGDESAARRIANAADGAYGLDALAQFADRWWRMTADALPGFVAAATAVGG